MQNIQKLNALFNLQNDGGDILCKITGLTLSRKLMTDALDKQIDAHKRKCATAIVHILMHKLRQSELQLSRVFDAFIFDMVLDSLQFNGNDYIPFSQKFSLSGKNFMAAGCATPSEVVKKFTTACGEYATITSPMDDYKDGEEWEFYFSFNLKA